MSVTVPPCHHDDVTDKNANEQMSKLWESIAIITTAIAITVLVFRALGTKFRADWTAIAAA